MPSDLEHLSMGMYKSIMTLEMRVLRGIVATLSLGAVLAPNVGFAWFSNWYQVVALIAETRLWPKVKVAFKISM